MEKHDTALLMIDFQRDFCSPGGYADLCGGIDWVRPAIPHARRLLEAARAAGLRIIHTRESYLSDLSNCPPTRLESSARAGVRYGATGPMGRIMVQGEYGNDLIDELAALPGEIVLDKPSYGAFATTPIDGILRSMGVIHLVIAGVTADVCVHTTLREAVDRGYRCHYVRDAITTFDPAIREACERMILQEGGVWGELTEVDTITRHWQKKIGDAV